MATPLILASGSASRASVLRQAGIPVEINAAAIDETEIKLSLRGEGVSVERVAEALAEAKAQYVARRFPGGYVIGADQMLEIDGDWLDKPRDLAEAERHLRLLRGRRHRLICSAVLVKDGTRLWHHTAQASLTMRPFSDDFLAQYLAITGPQLLGTVGCYQLEGLGAQLFERIDGDFFTILGLPLLPLLAILRQHQVIAS
ncbi:MAG: Maf family protein [Dongiaceae bacterium]